MANFFDSIKAAFAPNPELKKAQDAAKAAQAQEKQTAEALKQAQQKPAGEFSPTNVFKDVVQKFTPKNLPLNLPEVPKKIEPTSEEKAAQTEKAKNFFTQEIPTLAKTIARAGPRAAAQFTLSARGEKEFVPGTGRFPEAEKFLLGEQPVKAIRETGQETIESFGGSKETAKRFGLPVGAVFGVLDLIPGFGGTESKLIRTIAKLDDAEKIAAELRAGLKVAKEADDAEVAALSARLATVKDPKVVKQELDAFQEAQKSAAAIKTTEEAAPIVKAEKPTIATKAVEKEIPPAVKTTEAAPAISKAEPVVPAAAKAEEVIPTAVKTTKSNPIPVGLTKSNAAKFLEGQDLGDIKGVDRANITSMRTFGSSVEGKLKPKDIDMFVTVKPGTMKFRTQAGMTSPNVVRKGKIQYFIMPEGDDAESLLDAMLYTGRKDAERGYTGRTVTIGKKYYTEPNAIGTPKSAEVIAAPPIQPPITPPATPLAEAAAKGGSKERAFATAVKESPETTAPLKEELKARDLTYEPLANKTIVEKAKARVANPDEAMAYISAGKEADAEQVATSIELIRKYQAEGKYAAAGDAAEVIAEKLTRAGQTVQAAKLYAHLKPEAILIKARQLVDKLNARKFRWQKDIVLDENTIKSISETAKKMNEATDPIIKTELAEELQSVLSKIPRPSIMRKTSMIQTMAQLLNPKTILVRNPLGNEIFYRLERLNKWATSPVDWARSTLTGADRAVTFRTGTGILQGTYWKDWLQGLKSGWKGINPAGLGSQFDIYAPAFNGKWNPLTYMEKSLGASLRSFDYAAYKRAVSNTIGEMSWLKAYNEGKRGAELADAAKTYAKAADEAILQIADDYGKYITFQDNNVISRALSATKRGLNVGKEFGLGDLVLKYPRTPGALLMRAMEYSPAGFLRSAYLIAQPLLKGGKYDLREIETALSRAITGSAGLTGLGYYLADKGIITGRPDENQRVTGIERAVGAGRYQVNLSALKRWVESGFQDVSIQKGDQLYSYDWAQPIAVSLSLGANMNENVKATERKQEQRGPLAGIPGTAESSITGAVQTIAEQPLLTGIQKLFGGQDIVSSVLDVVESLPSSFTPTLTNQFRQVSDPYSRETYSTSLLTRSVNRAKSRLPELSDELPARYTVFGEKQKVMESPTLFNIFLNPGFASTYKPTPAAQLVLDIYNETGETGQLPKVAPKYLVFQGKRVNLEGEQISEFQKNIGKATDVAFTALAKNEGFQKMPNTQKVQALNYLLGKLYEKQRYMILSPDQRKGLVEGMDDAAKEKFVKDLVNAMK